MKDSKTLRIYSKRRLLVKTYLRIYLNPEISFRATSRRNSVKNVQKLKNTFIFVIPSTYL